MVGGNTIYHNVNFSLPICLSPSNTKVTIMPRVYDRNKLIKIIIIQLWILLTNRNSLR